eukprot:3600704-Alexandrium_andersonii.AAC.1
MTDPQPLAPRPRGAGAPESPPAAWGQLGAAAGRCSHDRSTSGVNSEPRVWSLSGRRSRGRSAKS